MSIYCTYITFYRGNKLPPFYIGSTSVEKVNNGYHGSVSSREYKCIWNSELRDNPHLFETKIITFHTDRKSALEREEKLQRSLQVIKNSLYTNKSFATSGCFGDTMTGRKHSAETIRKITLGVTGKKRTPEQCKRIGDSKRGIKHSEDQRLKQSIASKGKPSYIRTEEHRKNISERQTGQHLSDDHKNKITEGLKKYWYITPFGKCDDPRIFQEIICYTTLRKWCITPDVTINLKSYTSSKWLKKNFTFDEVFEKSLRDLGFYRILK